MNAIFFGAKRAFHATLHLTRKHLAAMGLTAARFDMLWAINHGRDHMLQRSLRDLLGVTAATISRMLRSLEELGLIVRERLAVDRRHVIVRLTEIGRRLLRRASKRFIESGAMQLAVDCALAGDRAFDEGECIARMESAETMLENLECAFHRHAELIYPWHPDD